MEKNWKRSEVELRGFSKCTNAFIYPLVLVVGRSHLRTKNDLLRVIYCLALIVVKLKAGKPVTTLESSVVEDNCSLHALI